jgi:hypothetical protein
MLGAKHTAGTGWSKLQVGLEKAGSLIVTRVKLHRLPQGLLAI